MSALSFIGIFELDIEQSSNGENIYIVDFNNVDGKPLRKLIENYYDEPVKVTIERLNVDK